MKRLLLLRHAKSSWKNRTLADFDRPLNDRGRRSARAMGRYMLDQGLAPARVLCSEAARAQETWELAAESLAPLDADGGPEVEILHRLYLASPRRMLDVVRQQGTSVESLLLIAHNPGMAGFAALLAGAHSNPQSLTRLSEKYPTAALAELEFDGDTWATLKPGGARLQRFVAPRDIGETAELPGELP